MKERPVLFSAPMVRALLAGTKTQTRRVVKGDVEDVRPPDWYAKRRLVHRPTCQRSFCENVDDGELACGGYEIDASGGVGARSPYGEPGDRLWVRETAIVSPADWGDMENLSQVVIDRDGKKRAIQYLATAPNREAANDFRLKATPPIFMPRWASRIDLEVVAIRVEPLNDIDEAEARAEGADSLTASMSLWKGSASQMGCARAGYPDAPRNTGDWTARDCFRLIWGAINGPGSWAKNPWVWVIEFKVVRP